MSNLSDVLYLNASQHLSSFDRPLVQMLSGQVTLAQWEHCQHPDRPCSLETALESLHCDLKVRCNPVHLVGHGISGLLGLLYAQYYPEQVRSLTLLSVGIAPAQDWQAQYYMYRRALECDRQTILEQLVHELFGFSSATMTQRLVGILEQDLDYSLSGHSLLRSMNLLPIRATVPLLVCGSVDDAIVDAHQLRRWKQHFAEAVLSRLWICSGGRHFFHFFYAEETAEQLLDFWASIPVSKPLASESLSVGA